MLDYQYARHHTFIAWFRNMNCLNTNDIIRLWLIAILGMSLLGCGNSSSVDSTADSQRWSKILDGQHRSSAHKSRDKYRHPRETLTWFGIEPDMTVVELVPGGGWYTEILAAYLDRGTLYVAGLDPDSASSRVRDAAMRFRAMMKSADVYKRVELTVLAPPQKTAIAPPGLADAVVTFRNIHNWMKAGTADDVFNAAFTALKPGGILGVVEHRGNPDVPQDPRARNGYVNQDYAIHLIEKAGFKFVGSSEINANPGDTRDHPMGVWTLPPTLAMKDKDRQRYLDIGESDRFTLKFIKPGP